LIRARRPLILPPSISIPGRSSRGEKHGS
jgi:hypothetical protein